MTELSDVITLTDYERENAGQRQNEIAIELHDHRTSCKACRKRMGCSTEFHLEQMLDYWKRRAYLIDQEKLVDKSKRREWCQDSS